MAAIHDTMGSSKDPHMKNPMPKYILIAIVSNVVVILLLIFVAPKVYEIYRDNLNDTTDRAEDGELTSNTIRDK